MKTTISVMVLCLALVQIPFASATSECKPDIRALGEAESDCLAIVVAGSAKGGTAVAVFGSSEGSGLCLTGSGSASCWGGLGIVGYGCSDSHHDVEPLCPRSSSTDASAPSGVPVCVVGLGNRTDQPIYIYCWEIEPSFGAAQDIPTCGVGFDRPPGFPRVWAGCFDPEAGDNIVWFDTYPFVHLDTTRAGPTSADGPIPTCGAGLSEMGFPAVWAGCFDPNTGKEIIWVNSWALVCRGRC